MHHSRQDIVDHISSIVDADLPQRSSVWFDLLYIWTV